MASFGKRALRGIYRRIPFKQSAFQVIRRSVRLPERLYRHLHFEGDIVVAGTGDVRFRMRHFGYQVENDLFWAGYGNGFEATSLRLWARLCATSQTILDIGANTGVYALAAAAVNPTACVVAFEPLQRIAQRLSDNVRLNGFDVEVIVAGVSATTGEAVIYEPCAEHAYSASLNSEMLAGRADLRESTIAVTRLDDFATARGLRSIDLVKIDTEKHEMAVLRGFGYVLARHRPTLLIEVLDTGTGAEIERLLVGLGYAFHIIEERTAVRPVQSLMQGIGNFLICQPEVATALGLDHGSVRHEALAG
jgi:FkbM family methyltransferase